MSVYENLSETRQFACRVIADHARATAFAIADGILPGNEGRNYVLRKIMRRAIYHGREHLGLNDLFFYKVCDFVIEQMHSAYPELEAQRDFIGKMVRIEEERFSNTLTLGLRKLEELLSEKHGEMKDGVFDFNELAKIYDTYGVPQDLIRVVLEEKGFLFSESDFMEHFERQHRLIQASAHFQSSFGFIANPTVKKGIYSQIAEKIGFSQFYGYQTTSVENTEVVALVKDEKIVENLKEGDEGLIVLNNTPFYAEAGGQVGDTGFLSGIQTPATAGGTDTLSTVSVKVLDTFAPIAGIILHKSKVEKGSIKVGDVVTATVDVQKRDATRRNHTGTHLLHAALREVLGTHVKQAGSVVAPNYLRFDFTHYQPLTEAEVNEIEDLVNRYILENHPVTTNIMAIEEAMRGGAMALFGEKYGSDVRVLSVGDGIFSKELCGGTHVKATGDIGSFKITADEAIASGVRRIRAITGLDAFERFRDDERLIDRSLGALKTQRDNLPHAIERLQEDLKRTRREMDELKLKIATGAIGSGSAGGNGDEPRDVAGVKVLGKIVDGLDANGQRQLSDTLLARLKSGVVVLGRRDEDKVSIIVRVSSDLTGRVKAGNVIKEIAPIVGGRGGGKPDMAEGGGNLPDKLSEAIDSSYKVIETFLSS
ncbi:MAG TPA: alanine--tRNA ligase [Pyrinomonadaceae bacterium]|nr:alanine--tRNA ligase [Pyrinomonadaceae bacterium]